MRAYEVSVNSKLTTDEKIDRVDEYSTSELFGVLDYYKRSPSDFQKVIIESVYDALFRRGFKFTSGGVYIWKQKWDVI